MLKKRLGIEAIERGDFLQNFYKIPPSLIIPEGVKEISSQAFYDCRNLKKVVIPESVNSIGDYAFEYCKDLEDVIIQGVLYIKWYAFGCCPKLKRVIISEGVKDICMDAFLDCINLEEVIIPKSTMWIGSHAFDYCEKATIILNKPKSEFIEIGYRAFGGCKDVKEEVGN